MPQQTMPLHRRSARTSDSPAANRSRHGLRLFALVWVCCAALVPGCSRSFWREQADADVYQAIGDKLTDPRWASPRLDITPDPRSRFFDPHNPDCAPLPPDDATAHVSMHCVDGKQGYGGWHKFGDEFNVENPVWLANFGITPDLIDPVTGAYHGHVPALDEVSLAEAVELSLIHSREYQTILEDVYLAALDVTFERFQFGVRYLGLGGEPSSNATYSLRPEGRADQLGWNNRFGVSQLLPAGGQIALELANSTIWLFGPDSTSSASNLSYSLVQPLLLGAGRKIVLESLTQTERNLLYALRDLARFRQQFFTDVVGSNGGYLGLLQQLQAIRNQEDNIIRIERNLAELQAASKRPGIPWHAPLERLPEGMPIQRPEHLQNPLQPDPEPDQLPESLRGPLRFEPSDGFGEGDLSWLGPMSDEQEQALRGLSNDPDFRRAANELIEQVRAVTASLDELQLQSSLASARTTLRDLRRRLQDSLDSYKLRLGLPTDMPIGIDDGLLVQFQFIDPILREFETEVDAFILKLAAISEDDPDHGMLLAAFAEYTALIERIRKGGLGLLDQDVKKVEANLSERLGQLDTDADRDRVREDIAGDLRRLANLRVELERLAEAAGIIQGRVAIQPTAIVEDRQVWHKDLKILRENLLQVVRGMTVTEIGLRLELITVRDFEMPLEQAVATAIDNRVDLMNDRALVMDARRQVEVSANQLMSRIDLVAEGDIRNTGRENPVDFRLDRSEFRFGLQFTAPLDQIQERNAYRAAQISYQRSRRAYMLAEDQVKLQVRQAWRQLDIVKGNLDISRQAVRIAARQLDSAVQLANDPAAQAETGAGGNRGQQLLNGLRSVLDAQNSLLGNWINYEQNRLNIYRDMGMMEVGPSGLWNDPFYQSAPDASSVPTAPPSSVPKRPDQVPPDAAHPGGGADPGPGDGVVPVGYFAELAERRPEPRLQPPATSDRRQIAVPRERFGAGARRQPEELDSREPGGGLGDDYQHRPGGNLGEGGGGRVRTRLLPAGG
jgi:hypothetical protein